MFSYPAYDSSERHGHCKTEEYKGEIVILTEKGSLSRFDFSSSTNTKSFSSKKIYGLTLSFGIKVRIDFVDEVQ